MLITFCHTILFPMSSRSVSNGSATATATAATASASSDVVDVAYVELESAVTSNNRSSTWVWGYLTPVTSNDQIGPKCNVCSQVINYGKSKSTSTLVSHFLYNIRSFYDDNLSVDVWRSTGGTKCDG